MGLYDTLRVNDPRFVCSEGHSLANEEFQSKDFGCTMGHVHIEHGSLSMHEGYCGTPEADSATVEIYCTCRQCPAFVQFGTGNLVDCNVTFEVVLSGTRIAKVTRTSDATSVWLHTEPQQRHMNRCEGPMTYEDAQQLHRHYRERRIDAYEEFARWSEARAKTLQAGRPWPWELAVGEYPEGHS